MEYETEEQQVEALKAWWAENGKSVMLGVGIGVAAIGGWQFWGKHKESQAREASDGYEQTIQSLADGGNAADVAAKVKNCLLYTSPSPRDLSTSRMPSSA